MMKLLKAGYGKVKITPPLGLELCGFGYYLERRATAVRADLYAMAMYLEADNGTAFVLINCDLIGFRPAITRLVRQTLAARLSLIEANIMLTATHTHTGPATYDIIGCGEADAAYLAELPPLLVAAAVAAHADARQVTGFSAFEVEIGPIGFNRTPGGGFADSHVRGCRMQRGGAPDLALLNYGCHPVSYSASPEVSPDYPGRVVARLAGAGIAAIFINGPCGDIDPLIRKARSPTLAEVDDAIDGYAIRIAAAYLTTMKNSQWPVKELPCWRKLFFTIDLPLQAMDEEQIRRIATDVAAEYGVANPFSVVVRLWQEHWHENFRKIAADRAAGWLQATGSDKPYTERAGIHVLVLGPILLVGIPYEVFTSLRTLIAAAFPEKTVLVAGNTDTTLGYLVSRSAVRQSYEALESTYLYKRLPFADGALELLAAAIISRVKEQLN